MRDIRRRYPSSKSRSSSNHSEIIGKPFSERHNHSAHEIAKRAERFEKGEYDEFDIESTRDGTPLMKASSHFDMKGISRRKKEEYDVLKREAFFNKNRREFDEENVKDYRRKRNAKKRSKKIFWYSLLFLIIAGLVGWTFFFNSAKITVNPKYRDVDVSDTFLFFREDILVDSSSSTLAKTVLKSAPKEVNQKAGGEITIYNNYSADSQVLIKNTRFQTSDGKVFRISDSVTVPGKVGNTPGSIKAKVSADSYGAEYNIGPSDFTIPGFKGSARYDGFYAKSISEMVGGASGMIQTVAQSDIDAASTSLKETLEGNLRSALKAFTHDGYFSLYNNPLVTYSDNQALLATTDANSYELNGTANLISIKNNILAKMIARQVLKENYNEMDTVRLDNIDGLVFTIEPETNLNDNVIKVVIAGKTRIIWTYDENNIKISLTNKKISTFSSIMKNYESAIDFSSFTVSPPWARSFPDSPSRIKIIEELK